MKADWPSFRKHLDAHLQKTEIPNLDPMEQRIMGAFHHAANTAILMTKTPKRDFKDRWYYNSKVKEYNHRVNMATKLNRSHHNDETRTLLRATISIAREATKKIKIDEWLEWCSHHGEVFQNKRDT